MNFSLISLNIRLQGDPILTTPCQPVTEAEIRSGEAQKWAGQLINFLKAYRKETGAGRGLAANQIGVSKQIILVWLDDGPTIYINPEVVRTEGKGIYPESCISATSPVLGDVIRPWRGTFAYTDLKGECHETSADEMHTRLLLHEIDHLRGVLCTDLYEPGTIREIGTDKDSVLKAKLKRL